MNLLHYHDIEVVPLFSIHSSGMANLKFMRKGSSCALQQSSWREALPGKEQALNSHGLILQIIIVLWLVELNEMVYLI